MKHLLVLFFFFGGHFVTIIGADETLPNIVLIFIDDMGYADIGPFGARDFPTPNLDRLAEEGRRFTDFAVSAPVCSASRAALLTGALHIRLGISGAYSPQAKEGIHEREMTLVELCKQKGYATAIYGKWHLGHHPKFSSIESRLRRVSRNSLLKRYVALAPEVSRAWLPTILSDEKFIRTCH